MADRVPISPNTLKWALAESQVDENKIRKKFPRISEWLSGDVLPTFNQFKDLSKTLHIPLGIMFLETPPTVDPIRSEFRTISNIKGEMSKNLKDTLLDMDFKKNWMSDFRRENGWEKLTFVGIESDSSNHSAIKSAFYRYLPITDDWFCSFKTSTDAYDFLRSKLESIGILVMQNGVVGKNTHRTLDLNEFRAFMLIDDYAPLIFVNRKDSHTGMIFSLVHEFLHILLGDGDILIGDEVSLINERLLNALTAEILMPHEFLQNRSFNTYFDLETTASILHVSPLSLAIRLNKMGLVDNQMVLLVRQKMHESLENREKASPGGNFYATLQSRLPEAFINAVILQAETGGMRYTDAYQLLGVSGKSFQELKDRMVVYGG